MTIASLIASVTGIKGYLYAALAAALLSGGLYFVHHERVVGEQKIEKKDAALHAAAVALNTASAKLADIQEITIGHTYERFIAQPAIADAPGLVCHNSAPAVEPSLADNRPSTDGAQAVVPDGGFNPSGGILTLLSDDDAQISGLIDTVIVLENELKGKTK